MKILCLTPWFPSHRQDQTGNFILDSVEALATLGHKITILVTQPWRPKLAGLISKDWVKKKINALSLPNTFTLNTCQHFSIPRNYFRSFSNLAYSKRVSPLLEKLAKDHHCDLIHAHTEIPGLVAVNVGTQIGIPTVVTLHGINTDKKLYYGKTKQQLFEHTLTNADRVILVGDPLVNFFKSFTAHHDHFRVVYNGFRAHANQLTKKIWTEQLRLISISNLHAGKGIDLNLYALAKLKLGGIKNWTYKIIGDGHERKNLEKLANTLNLHEYVSFLGACSHDEVYRHLAASDIFILPSYREAFGIAYLEAMSFGLLTIGVQGQGPQAFIEHQKTGLLVQPQDVDALINTLKILFASPNRMQEIAKAGREHVSRHFTWQHHAENVTKIYMELVR